MPKKGRSTRQAATSARSEHEAGRVSGVDDSTAGSWAGQMEEEEQQLPGSGNRGQGAARLNVPANMQPAVGLGRGGTRSMLAQTSPAGYTNPPVQSPDALAVASVLPLIKMVRSQDAASRMQRADLHL
jgi:hypothetical protein